MMSIAVMNIYLPLFCFLLIEILTMGSAQIKEFQSGQIALNKSQTSKNFHAKKKRMAIWAPTRSAKQWKTADLQTEKIRESESTYNIFNPKYNSQTDLAESKDKLFNDRRVKCHDLQNKTFSKNLLPERANKKFISKNVTDCREWTSEIKNSGNSNVLKLNKKLNANDEVESIHRRYGSTGTFVKAFDVSMKPIRAQKNVRLSQQFIAKDKQKEMIKIQLFSQEMQSFNSGSTQSTIIPDHSIKQ
ncbi:unnamed protein product [Blepharisma stoltei]|uniref:Uncharacterized protein n=1 Tax=Blepharisma stoltei TaxID=1481888 RepID=A0AAU9J6N6_9CILI|nr:unnamed protein product [Blepharisma stoltei]